MNTKKILIAALLALAFGPAFAMPDAGDEAGGPAHVEKIVIMNGGHEGAVHGNADNVMADGPFGYGHVRMRKLVKNAPYSAEVVSERIQNLVDGNQINNRSSSTSYRDSAGRTRNELRDKSGEVRAITIHDPVSGSTFMLRPKDKTATKLPGRSLGAHGDKEHVKIMHKDGKAHVVEHNIEGPDGDAGDGGEREKIVVKHIERNEGDVSQRVRENVRINVIRNHELAKGAHLGPLLANAFGDAKWAMKATTRELGSRDFDGVKADGKMRSYEIPAGEVGNRNPITVSDETWYSPALQVTVYTKHSDPRSGERIYRLANLKRDEPAAALFTVPSDYTVKDVALQIKEARARAKAISTGK
jgi:hypothetical protein